MNAHTDHCPKSVPLLDSSHEYDLDWGVERMANAEVHRLACSNARACRGDACPGFFIGVFPVNTFQDDSVTTQVRNETCNEVCNDAETFLLDHRD
jgi:hypothetical protein